MHTSTFPLKLDKSNNDFEILSQDHQIIIKYSSWFYDVLIKNSFKLHSSSGDSVRVSKFPFNFASLCLTLTLKIGYR